MEYQELHETAAKLELIHPSHTSPRAAGVHLYDIIKAMCNDLFPREAYPEWDGLTAEEQQQRAANFTCGFVWEDMLSRAWGAELAPRISDAQCEGIWINPDGVRLDDAGGCVWEYKFTAISSNKRPDEVLRWMMQVKFYCFAMGVLRARFIVLHAEGDYVRPFKRAVKEWEYTFTREELDDNMRAIINYARSKGMIQ